MCYHLYTRFFICNCVAIHYHQCSLCLNYFMIIWCENYTTLEEEDHGACPNHAHKLESSAVPTLLPKSLQFSTTTPGSAPTASNNEHTAEQNFQIPPRNPLPRLLPANPAIDTTPSYPTNLTRPLFPSPTDMAHIFPDLYPFPGSNDFFNLPQRQYLPPQHPLPNNITGLQDALKQRNMNIAHPTPTPPTRNSKTETTRPAVIVTYNPETRVFERPGRNQGKKSGAGVDMGL